MKQFQIPSSNYYHFKLITSSDFELLASFRQNKELMQALDKEVESDEKVNNMLQTMPPKNTLSNNLWWLIYSNEDILLGNFGIKIDLKNKRGEIGYVLYKEHWSKKIMSTALGSLLNFAIELLNLHSLEAKLSPHNIASKKLLLNHNFIKEGHIKEDYYFNGYFLDTEIYSLLKHNYVPRETK